MRRNSLTVGAASLGALIAVTLGASAAAHAQSAPDTENGRFSLAPVPEGFLRMDGRTGAVSLCTSAGGWTCRLVPDERTALDSEIGRLQAENKALKESAQSGTTSGKTDMPLAKEDSKKSAQASPDNKMSPDKKIELQLPPEHEKLMALIDRVWDRLIDMAVRLQKRLSEKI